MSIEKPLFADVPVTLGSLLYARRSTMGLTQVDLADILSQKFGDTISAWERGERVPSRDQFDIIAYILSFSPSETGIGLLLGRYQTTDEEDTMWGEKLKSLVNVFEGPAIIRSYDGRIIGLNSQVDELVSPSGIDLSTKPLLIDVVLGSSLAQDVGHREYLKQHIAAFQFDTKGLSYEPWFLRGIARLNLNPVYAEIARELRYEEGPLLGRPLLHTLRILNYAFSSSGKDDVRQFHQISKRAVDDNRYQVDFFIPAK